MEYKFLLVFFLLSCAVWLLYEIKKSKNFFKNKIYNESYTIELPNIVLVIGAVCSLMATTILFSFTFLSQQMPHLIFYIIYGLFFVLGIYLVLKTAKFKIIVVKEEIRVYPIFAKPYMFTYREIVHAKRQRKKKYKTYSERIIIKISNGKKIVVESTEVSYKRFANDIRVKVDEKRLDGFTDTGDGSLC